jgi:hypothetical protein
MLQSVKARSLLLVMALLIAAAFGDGEALASAKIVDVKISPDARRVIVTADGAMIPAGICRLEGTSKLAIDIPGIGLGDVERSIRSSAKPGLMVNVSRTVSGVRLELDFGNSPVPEHKIRRMENCLVLLLSPWTAAASPEEWSAPAGDHGPPTPTEPAVPRKKQRHIKSGGHPADLEVKSAEVNNGVIVLTVAKGDNPDRLYRIDLGVDLEQSGFHAASIRRVKDQDPAAAQRSGGKSRTAAHPVPPRGAAKPALYPPSVQAVQPAGAGPTAQGSPAPAEAEMNADQHSSVSLLREQ